MPQIQSPSQSPANKAGSPSGGASYAPAYGGGMYSAASPSYNTAINRPGAGPAPQKGAAYDPDAPHSKNQEAARNSDSSSDNEGN